MSNENMETMAPKIDLLDLFHGLIQSVRHFLRFGVVLMVICALTVCFYKTWTYQAYYEASASFTVRVSNPLYGTQQYYNNSAAEQMAKTFPYILTSSAMSQQIKKEMGMSWLPSITASSVGNTNIFTMKVTSTDPKLAYDVLQCVMEHYPSVSEFVIGPTTMTLLNETGIPQHAINPLSLKSSAFTGVMIGAALWMMIAGFYWLTHQTISNETELGRLVNLQCLGKLPVVKGINKKSKIKCPILSEHNDKYGFNESMRLLRVRVEKEMNKSDAKVLLVTSSIANEGKTTISLNLAHAFAHKGKKTLLIDCDLRNPSVASTLGINVEYGFSDYLKGQCKGNEILSRLDTENLYAVFSGKPVSSPEKLLTSSRAQNFLAAARQMFDVIILDTPPCALMADAAEICALADCALLTVRQDFATHGQIMEGVSILEDGKRPILGCVMNMSNVQPGKNSYSYYGYYGQYGNRSDKTGKNDRKE